MKRKTNNKNKQQDRGKMRKQEEEKGENASQ